LPREWKQKKDWMKQVYLSAVLQRFAYRIPWAENPKQFSAAQFRLLGNELHPAQ